jgi:hypothetical protein
MCVSRGRTLNGTHQLFPTTHAAPLTNKVNQWFQASDFTDEGTRPAKQRTAVKEAYRMLVEQGTSTRDDIRAAASVSGAAQPEQDHYPTREQWWQQCGRPALASLPGVEPSVIQSIRASSSVLRPRGTARTEPRHPRAASEQVLLSVLFAPEGVLQLATLSHRVSPRLQSDSTGRPFWGNHPRSVVLPDWLQIRLQRPKP